MPEIAVIKGHDIRDKKLADATSQSTVASTDAIEMKTTTGDQVYITRDSFVQAMASVLNSNSQSTISQLFGADANGNHAAINMSNLASVLGVAKNISLPLLHSKCIKVATIKMGSYRKVGFAFSVLGYTIIAHGVFSLSRGGGADDTAIATKYIATVTTEGFSFVVVDAGNSNFDVYATGTFSSSSVGSIVIVPIGECIVPSGEQPVVDRTSLTEFASHKIVSA